MAFFFLFFFLWKICSWVRVPVIRLHWLTKSITLSRQIIFEPRFIYIGLIAAEQEQGGKTHTHEFQGTLLLPLGERTSKAFLLRGGEKTR